MRVSHAAPLLVVTARFVSAQQIVPTSGTSTFPACAVGCPILLKAQTVCTPPNAITATQDTYDNCFCLVPDLVDLYTTGQTLCTDQCFTTADRQQLSTWFVAFCQQAGSSLSTASTSATQTTHATASTLSTSTVSTSSPEPTRAATTYDLASSNDGPWLKTHWGWIIMLVFLFFGLLGIGLGARWWKKRHNQRADQRRAGNLNFPPSKGDTTDKERAVSPDTWEHKNRSSVTKSYQYTQNGNLPIISEHQDYDNTGNPNDKKDGHVAITEIDPVPTPVHTRSS